MGWRSLVLLCVGIAIIPSAKSVRSQYPDPGQHVSIYSSKSESIPRVVRLVHYLYGGGPSPQPVAFVDNANCEGGVDVIDVVYLVNWALRNGPAPCEWSGWYRDPADTRDAETIAMWESGELTAPAGLLQRVQSDLRRLRTLPGADQIAIPCLPFAPPWNLSRIGIRVDSASFYAMQQGTYHEWDSLNAVYGALWADFEYYGAPGLYFATGTFDGIYNSPLLAILYDDLPGIETAYEMYSYWIGESFPDAVFPQVRGDTNTYLFKMAWDFSGIYGRHRYWYGMALPDSAWIVGDWDPKLQPEPGWWERAQANIEHFWDH